MEFVQNSFFVKFKNHNPQIAITAVWGLDIS